VSRSRALLTVTGTQPGGLQITCMGTHETLQRSL
jgi:hypothetical protein